MREFINIINESIEPPAMDEKAMRKRVKEIISKKRDILHFVMEDVERASDGLADGNQERYDEAMTAINRKIEALANLTKEDKRLRPDYYAV